MKNTKRLLRKSTLSERAALDFLEPESVFWSRGVCGGYQATGYQALLLFVWCNRCHSNAHGIAPRYGWILGMDDVAHGTGFDLERSGQHLLFVER